MAETSTLTLTDFLLARIAEDERAARGEIDLNAAWHRERLGASFVITEWMLGPASPDRVLAECEAKRRIVELHAYRYASDDPETHYGSHWETIGGREMCIEDEEPFPPNFCRSCSDRQPCPTLRALALPYADHPDYREEW